MTKDHSWNTDKQTKPRLLHKKMKKMWPEKWNKNENKNVRIIQDSKDDIQIKSKIV